MPSGWSPEGVRTHVDTMLPVVVGLWTTHGEFPTLGLLFLDGECVVVPQVAGMPKEVVPTVLRGIAAEAGAGFVGLVTEATMVDFAHADTTPEAWAAMDRPLSEHPNAVDCLCFTVDGPGVSIFARVWRDPAGNLCTEVHDKVALEGRMTNLSGRLGEN